MHHVLGKSHQHLFRKVPPASVEQRVNLFLLLLQSQFGPPELFLCLFLRLKNLEVAVEIVPDVLEESIEVFLYDLELSPDEVSPLDGHVVQSNVEFVQLEKTLGFGHAVEHLPGLFMELSEQIPHLVQSIHFVGLQSLQSLSLPSDLLVEFLDIRDHFPHFLQIGLVLKVEVYSHLSAHGLHMADTPSRLYFVSIFFQLIELALVLHL